MSIHLDHDAVARALGQVAELLGCDDDEVIFTPGGTEANNLAIRGVVETRNDRRLVRSWRGAMSS